MGVLDHPLTGGQSVVFDKDWHNELVAKLKALEQASEVRLQTSADRVLVHPNQTADGDDANDFPLVPGQVHVSDITRWGRPSGGDLRVRYSLVSGPGHLEPTGGGSPTTEVVTGPGAKVVWDWDRASSKSYYDARPERAWDAVVDGKALPGAVQVRAEAEVLTLETTADAVDQVSDLSGVSSPTDGEKRLVREAAEIHVYDAGAGSWSVHTSVAAEDYASVSSATTGFVVGRGYDPAAQPGVVPKLEAHQDVAYIGADGTVTVDFDDFTTTGNESTTARTLSATLRGTEGIVSIDQQIENGDDITGLDDSDLQFSVTAQSPGLLVVEASYDGDSDVKTTRRAVRIRPALDTKLGATSEPALPPLTVTAGKGETRVSVADEVSPQNLSREKPVFDAGADNSWVNARSQELARRLGIEDLTGDAPQLQMLYKAGALLTAALHQPTENGLFYYELQLPAGTGAAGQVLLFEEGAIRLRQKKRTAQTASGQQITTWQGVGAIEPDSDVSTALLTGNGSRFEVEARLAYGTVTEPSFPDETITQRIAFDPGAEEAALTLPRRTPTKATDAWYIQTRVRAGWEDGKHVTGEWTEWSAAEQAPDTSAEAKITTDGGATLGLSAEGDPIGAVQWGRPGQSPLSDAQVFDGGQLPASLPVSPPASLWDSPERAPHLYVRLLQTAPAGSARGQIERFDLTYPAKTAGGSLPVAPVEGNQIPSSWPVVNGMLVQGDTKNWIGLGEHYVPIGSGTGMIDKIELNVDGNVLEARAESPVTYTDSIQAYAVEGEVAVRLYTAGMVDNVELLTTDLSLVQPKTTPVSTGDGYFVQKFQVPSDAYGEDDRLLYRLTSGADEQIVSLTLENASISGASEPKVLSVSTLQSQNPDTQISVDRDGSPETWELALGDNEANWQDAFVTINVSGIGTASVVNSAVSGGGASVPLEGSDFRVNNSTDPQQIFLHLTDDAFSGEDVDITLKLKASSDSDAPSTTVKLQVRQSG